MPNWPGIWGTLAAGLGMYIATNFQTAKIPEPFGLSVADNLPDSLLPHPTKLSPEGPYAPNTLLQQAVKLFEGEVIGSESVAVGKDGTLYMADRWGFVRTARPAPGGGYRLAERPLAHLGAGRPLGLDLDPQGDLVVCVAGAGLVGVEAASGAVRLLATTVDIPGAALGSHTEINYANDVAVAADGVAYFSDSVAGVWPEKNGRGFWDTMRGFLLALYQGTPSGRLLRYDPATRATTVVAEGFWFANGVALAADEQSVALVETVPSRVHRVWVKGPKAGTREILIDGLPGVPDGIGRSSQGGFWVALVVPPSPLMAALRYKIVRWALAWSPFRPPIKNWGAVLEVSGEGRPLRFLQDPTGAHIHHASSAAEHGGRLFLGNLDDAYVSYVEVDALAAPKSPAGGAEAPQGLAPEAPGQSHAEL